METALFNDSQRVHNNLSDRGLVIFTAPMQGYTEAVWRHYHSRIFGGADRYFTPFVRCEHGAPRPRDIKDISSHLNFGCQVTPQIIFRDEQEFRTLTEAVTEAGYTDIDLNLGCPFTPQVRKGRGAGMLVRHDVLCRIRDLMISMPDVTFSLKMRPGIDDRHQWRDIMDTVNSMPLAHVTIHPRISSAGYSGEPDLDIFRQMTAALRHPVIYNGDLRTPDDITRITAQTDNLKGVMIGRGLLSAPWLAREWRCGTTLPHDKRLTLLKQLHDSIYRHYRDTLCGDSQILSKIKPFWEYLEPTIGHKAYKAIGKAPSLARYETATAAAFDSIG